MATTERLTIEVVYALPELQTLLTVKLPAGSTVAQATTPLNERMEFMRARPSCRHASKFQFSPPEREQMLSLKRAFDPKELLNPGKAIPSLARCAETAATVRLAAASSSLLYA